VNANAREALCAVLDHASYALQNGCMETRLQRAAIASIERIISGGEK
jgi:hypothetical protein